MMIEAVHQVLRGLHIGVGSIGLLLFWIPIFTRKGGHVHRAAGRWFVVTVYIVAGSGIVSSFWAFAYPASFLRQSRPSPEVIADVRFLFSILLLLAMLALQGALLGMRVLRVKDGGGRILDQRLSAVLTLQLALSVALAGYGVACLWQSGFKPRYYVTVALAVVGLCDFLQQFRFAIQSQPLLKGAWLAKHLECMLGCGVAFYTAASVTIFNRYVSWAPGAFALLPWFLPAVVGIVATAVLKRRYTGASDLSGQRARVTSVDKKRSDNAQSIFVEGN